MAQSSSQKEEVETKYLKRLASLKDERKPFEDEWQDITDYVLPRRSGWSKDSNTDKSGAGKIFDGTAIESLNLMCDGLVGYIVPSTVPFFRLRASIPQYEDVPQFRIWLDSCELEVLSAIERSNFYYAIGELFPDAGALGTGIMFMEEDEAQGRVSFSVRHLKECYLAENRFGTVDTVYRDFKMSRANLVEQFPNIDKAQKDRAEKLPDEKVEVIHIVEPGSARKFDSTYMLAEENNGSNGHILEQGGYDYFPYIVWRFRKNSDEVYGRSPAMDALYDVKVLNFMAKSLLEAAQKALEPPLVATEAMKGKIRINPKGVTYVESNNIAGQIGSLYGAAIGNYPIATDQYARRQQMVKQHFHTAFYSYLLSEEGSNIQKTATEINAMQAQEAAVLGSTTGRITKEVCEPVIRNIFAIEYREHRLPELPQQLSGLVGLPLSVEYTGPLAKKQKQFLQSQGIMDGASVAAQFMQINPNTSMNFDWDKISRKAVAANGMPADCFVDERAVAQQRQMIAQQQAQQQQFQMQLQAAKTIPAMSKSPQEGSPMEAMTKQVGGGNE